MNRVATSVLAATFMLVATALATCGGKSASLNSDAKSIDAASPIQYDRTFSIPNLDGKVSAFYDRDGVLSLQCETDADCLAAQGYFHAANRFFQMDLRRRFARGRLSELAGPILLDTDHKSRTLLATRSGSPMYQQLWDSADPKTVAAVEAYTRGVNAWIDDLRNNRNGAKLSAEYDFSIIDKTVISDWEPLDSIACFMPVLEQLTNRSRFDILAGEAAALLGPSVASDIFGVRVPSPSTIMPPVSTAAKKKTKPAKGALAPIASKWLSVLKSARTFMGPTRAVAETGSNSWVLTPRLGGGKALLANDPHLTMSNPATWFLVNIDSKTRGTGDLHIAGASFPGMPGILFGHNENLAWGVTTTYYDQADVYLETLNAAGDAVVFNGAEVPILSVEQEYVVSGGAPVTKIAKYVPHHGPILSIDTTAGTATSLRWTGQDADTDYNFLRKMWVATTVAEGKRALGDVTTAGQNFVLADTAGDIAWVTSNRVPKRPWMSITPSWRPLPGDGTAEWGDFIAYNELPQATNPASGYVATANNDMTGALFDGDPSTGQEAVQDFAADGYRHERISELIEAKTTHSLADMQAIAHDTKSLYGERITPILLADLSAATGLSSNATSIMSALQDWDFFCPTGFINTDPASPVRSTDAAVLASARGCAAFHVLWPRLRKETFNDELEAVNLNLFVDHKPMAIAFLRPDALSKTYWDDVRTTSTVEVRADIVVRAAEQAGTYLAGRLGSDSSDWLWGSVHSLYLPADLFDGAGISDFGEGPLMNDGAMSTVNVASPRNDLRDDYWHQHGPSLRLACEIGDADIACTYELPGGQRHHRDDPLYLSLLDRFLGHQPTALPFSMAASISDAAESILIE